MREEVAFGPLQLGIGRDEVEQRIADVLQMLEIADLADRAPYQLSGGQKKRVAIASVLVDEPRACCCSTSRPRRSTRARSSGCSS